LFKNLTSFTHTITHTSPNS